MQFLDWFVKEQGEEETNASDLIKKMELFGSDPKGLYMLDQELAGRVLRRPLPDSVKRICKQERVSCETCSLLFHRLLTGVRPGSRRPAGRLLRRKPPPRPPLASAGRQPPPKEPREPPEPPRRSLRQTSRPGCRRTCLLPEGVCGAAGRPAAAWPWPSGPSPEDGIVQHRGPPHAGPQVPPPVAAVPEPVQHHPEHQQHAQERRRAGHHAGKAGGVIAPGLRMIAAAGIGLRHRRDIPLPDSNAVEVGKPADEGVKGPLHAAVIVPGCEVISR